MKGVWHWWRDELAERPIMLAVLVVLIAVATMNFLMGLTIGGGFPGGVLLGGVFIAIAVCGAWAAHAQQGERGARRAAMIGLAALQLFLGSYCGLNSLGLTLSAGVAGLESRATARSTIADEHRRLTEERRAIGVTRPIATVAAGEKLECEIRSAQFPTGVGPKCTKLREELATARRAAEIDEKLPKLAAALAKAPAVTDAGAGTRVPEAIASAVATWWSGDKVVVSADQVRFAFSVFLVLLLELTALLGPWLFGRPPTSAHAAPAGAATFDPALLPRVVTVSKIAGPGSAANDGWPAGPPPELGPVIVPGGPGNTNIIHVGPSGRAEVVPPRIAARRGGKV